MNAGLDSPARQPARCGRILVVEDDEYVRRLAVSYLESDGHEVLQCRGGVDGLEAAEREVPDLLILDLTLPGMTGLELMKKVRARRDVPILVLTCNEDDDEVLAGYEAGADDCLAKPFSPRVLVARVRAILRRAASTFDQAHDRFAAGGIALDLRERAVTVAGRGVDLTASEFELLRVLMKHPGWVYTRGQLVEEVMGSSHTDDSRAIDGHVANLRKKVEEDPAQPRWIRTVRGVGYTFQASLGPEIPSAPCSERASGGH